MSGWSISSFPNAERCAAWWVAYPTARRMFVVVPITQSSRVWPTISMIVGTPRPGSPTRCASAVELDLRGGVGAVAELLLQPLDLEAGVALAVGQDAGQRVIPSGAWARTRKRSHIGAERTTCDR